MHRCWFVLSCLLVAPLLLISAQEKTKPPFRDKAASLKLFVEEFVSITPGQGKFPATFKLGSADGPKVEQPAHEVKIGRPFAMAKYEVTQELYAAVMGKN